MISDHDLIYVGCYKDLYRVLMMVKDIRNTVCHNHPIIYIDYKRFKIEIANFFTQAIKKDIQTPNNPIKLFDFIEILDFLLEANESLLKEVDTFFNNKLDQFNEEIRDKISGLIK